MKKILTFVFSLLVLTLFIPQTKADETFEITNFHADIYINQDSSFTVTEIIDVNFTQNSQGIYRDLDTQGILVKIKEILNQNNEPLNYTLEFFPEGTRIKIDNANKYITGDQTYKITYEVFKAIQFFDEHDEIYWNVTGNFWPTSISNASATIYLPTGTTAKKIACYTGPYESHEQNCTGKINGNIVEFKSNEFLNPNEG